MPAVAKETEAALTFDYEYLVTIGRRERDGFRVLMCYMRERLKDIPESAGQTVKKELLDIFERVLDEKVPERFAAIEKEKKSQKSGSQLSQWITAFGKNKPPQAKRKTPSKEKVAAETLHTAPKMKPTKSKVKCSKKQDHHTPDGPLIVGGIPPAIMPADAPQAPNPYGYDPLASVTPLGHKQLPSAYRRTPDMAQVPPSQKFRLQPQGHKAVVAATEQPEVVPEKPPETSTSSVPGPSNTDKPADREKSAAAAAAGGGTQAKSHHHTESSRFHRERERQSTVPAKTEYPELQYRSPLARTNLTRSSPNTYGGNKDLNRAPRSSDFREKEPSSSFPPEPYRRTASGTPAGHLQPTVRYWSGEAPSDAVVRPSHPPVSDPRLSVTSDPRVPHVSDPRLALPGDPRFPSAEGLSKQAAPVKDIAAKESVANVTVTGTPSSRSAEVPNVNPASSHLGSWKPLTMVAPTRSSQYVPLHSFAPAGVPTSSTSMKCSSEHSSSMIDSPGTQRSSGMIISPGTQRSSGTAVSPGTQRSSGMVVPPGVQHSTDILVSPEARRSSSMLVSPVETRNTGVVIPPGTQQMASPAAQPSSSAMAFLEIPHTSSITAFPDIKVSSAVTTASTGIRQDSVISSVSLPNKDLMPDFHRSNAEREIARAAKEVKKPEIRDLSITLNEDDDDATAFVATADELAELTKGFDVDERDSRLSLSEAGCSSVTSRKAEDSNETSSLQKSAVEPEVAPELTKIPTETVLQDLSSLTAEFNAVDD